MPFASTFSNLIVKLKTKEMKTQSKAQHWTVTNSNNSDFLDIDGESRICSIDISEPVLKEQGITRREAEANAKLIASAPLLLEALKAAQYYIVYKEGGENGAVPIHPLPMIVNAISKATN
jgi:hypothetical protein